MNDDVSVGGLLTGTARLIEDTARSVALYVLAIGGLTAVAVASGLSETSAMALGFGFRIGTDAGLGGALADLGLAVVNFIAGYLLLVRYLAARGRFQEGGERFWAYFGMSILSTIGVVAGFILLIVPGVILMIRWSAASGFLIGAREGVTDSLGASWRATDGHSWVIFGAAIVLFLVLAIAGGVVGGLAGLAGDLAVSIASAFVDAAVGAAFMALGIAIYCGVHDDSGELSEVFA